MYLDFKFKTTYNQIYIYFFRQLIKLSQEGKKPQYKAMWYEGKKYQ